MTAPKKKDDALATNPAAALGIPIGLVAEGDGKTGDEVTDEILAEIIRAGSVEKALAAGTVVGLKDFDGVELGFLSFKYQASKYASPKEQATAWPYVVIRCTNADGESITATTGARQVIALLALALQTNGFPFRARVKVTPFDTDEGERREVVSLETA